MKTFLLTLLATILLCGMPGLVSAVHTATESGPSEISLDKAQDHAKADWKASTRAEKKAKKQEVRKAVRAYKAGDMSEETLLLVIIAILLPPLAMGLYEGGLTGRFWLSLLLTLLFYLPGLVYTLIIILGEK